MRKKVVIQGTRGCFHHLAAEHFFGEEIVPVDAESFPKLFELAKQQDSCDYAIVAIENSIAGSILQNYGLLQESSLCVIGEVYINIQQNLLTLPGQAHAEIKEVHSHPMALQQCRHFLRKFLPHARLVETADTAISAKELGQKQEKGVAVIASTLAAELYGLEVKDHGIESLKNNQTRFFILAREKSEDQSFNKASVYFKSSHEVGSLSKILEKIATHNINLTKLQSFPSNRVNWEYFFHADLVFEDASLYRKGINEVAKLADKLEILGEYKRGKRAY